MPVAIAPPRAPRATHASLSLLRLFAAAILHHAIIGRAAPLLSFISLATEGGDSDSEPQSAADPQMWILLAVAIGLVLLGGAFAGLTIALMGQDEVYLHVIETSSDDPTERKNASKVLNLLKKGKHWVLVTLLVGNVITNETLPIVLDRSIGGGYAAAISSTVLVIIFGEIVPQSICVRYGLPIGALMSRFVLVLMWTFAPITWPTAKLLDRLLGEDHGQTYNKPGLKTLVTLHKTMGEADTERLNEDEVAIISGVLDLKAKSVGSIMTPMTDVFTLSEDDVLDEDTMDEIMREGYSRIPVHEPKNKSNFIGMLLVKMLITYDPEDAKKVKEFSLATLPETEPVTSCLDIINFFQQGKSHMVLVSDFPGQQHGAIGVVTLEDVIEELIGEEIVDESDVFVDVHKAIRRMNPAPVQRPRPQGGKGANGSVEYSPHNVADGTKGGKQDFNEQDEFPFKRDSVTASDYGRSPKTTTFLVRRKSSTGSPQSHEVKQVNMRHPEMRQQLRNLGPSNAASRPMTTRVSTVKIKPGIGTIPENGAVQPRPTPQRSMTVQHPGPTAAKGGIGQDLVHPGHDAKDGVQTVQTGYGTLDQSSPLRGRESESKPITAVGAGDLGQTDRESSDTTIHAKHEVAMRDASASSSRSLLRDRPTNADISRRSSRRETRSGMLTENFVDSGGMKKLVLEATSSGDDQSPGQSQQGSRKNSGDDSADDGQGPVSASTQKPGTIIVKGAGETSIVDPTKPKTKNKNKRKKKKKEKGGDNNGDAGFHDENTPLLER